MELLEIGGCDVLKILDFFTPRGEGSFFFLHTMLHDAFHDHGKNGLL